MSDSNFKNQPDDNSDELEKNRQAKIENFKLNINLDDDFEKDFQQENISSNSQEFPLIDDVDLPLNEEINSFSSKTDEIEKFGEEETQENKQQTPKKKNVATKLAKPKNNKPPKRNGCLYTMIYAVVIVIVSLVFSKYAIDCAYDFLGAYKEEGTVTIKIEPDFENDDIFEQLKQSGAVKEPFFFKLYAKMTKAKFYPGEYQIATNLDYEAILSSLQQNSNRTDKVKITFPEGYTIEQIARKLDDAKVCDYDEFMKEIVEGDYSNYSFIKAMIPTEKLKENTSSNVSSVTSDVSSSATQTVSSEPPYNPGAKKYDDKVYLLEGYMFPDTYEFYLYEKPRNVIKKFLNNFNNRFTKEMYDWADDMGMTLDEVITLASIVEKEVPTLNDRYKVASVFVNRLKVPQTYPKLQTNTTDYYPYTSETIPAGYVSKYDTYSIEGLPPGAICNPSLEAIKAVLQHSHTSYYFFVSDVNGKTYFATNLAQHEKNVAYANSVKKIEKTE